MPIHYLTMRLRKGWRGSWVLAKWEKERESEWARERERELVLPVSVHHTQSQLSVSLLSATLSSARAAHWDNILYLSFTRINQSFSAFFSSSLSDTFSPSSFLSSSSFISLSSSFITCCSHHLIGWRTHRTLEDRQVRVCVCVCVCVCVREREK